MQKAKIILNADGVPVKGYDVIYPPKGQAWEYTPLATNPYKGCGARVFVLLCATGNTSE